jgi:hypothetical protein
MVLDRASGGRTQQSPFDVNQDHDFSITDLIDFDDSGNEVASGVNVTGGTSGFTLSENKDVALIPRFDGEVTKKEMNLGVPVRGRQTWRQLR